MVLWVVREDGLFSVKEINPFSPLIHCTRCTCGETDT